MHLKYKFCWSSLHEFTCIVTFHSFLKVETDQESADVEGSSNKSQTETILYINAAKKLAVIRFSISPSKQQTENPQS
jgi:hypothetical protein